MGFDYSALARGPRGPRDDYGQDDDEQDENEDEDDAADFSIEPRAGYKHRIKPHLENDVHSDLEVDAPRSQRSPPRSVPSGSATPQRSFKAISHPASTSKPRFASRSNAPTNFPEFYTSRGVAGGSKFRPTEETEDSRYLAGIPGLRRPERRERNAPRFGDPADQRQSTFRVPVAFVKATGEYGDKLKGSLPPNDPNDAQNHPEAVPSQLIDARQSDSSPARHAGLGFANRPTKPRIVGATDGPDAPASTSQPSAVPYAPPRAPPAFQDMSVNAFDPDRAADDGEDRDEMNALLAAFPGSKELAPGESMLEDEADTSWTLPVFKPEAAATTSSTPVATEGADTAIIAETRADDLKVAVPPPGPATTKPVATANSIAHTYATSSDDDEEIILVPSHTSTSHTTPSPPVQPVPEANAQTLGDIEANVEVGEESELGFVIDLEGEDATSPSEHAIVHTSSSQRVALGDASSTAARRSRREQSSKPGRPRRIPREGDSDLDWGSDGPPSIVEDDGTDGDNLAAAAAGISITRSEHTEIITDPILAKAIRADRHEWESAEDDDDITMSIAKPSRRRGGQRAKRSLVNRAAEARNAAQLARSRRADQDAIVADYMQNILNQTADTSDEDEDVAANAGLFSNDDMAVENVGGDPSADASVTGKDKVRRLSSKLDDKTELDAMIRFMHGMDPQKDGRQLGFGDIEDENHMDEVREWLTESDADSNDSDDDADNSKVVVVDVTKSTADASNSKDVDEESASDEDEELAEQLRIILRDEDDEESSDIFSESSDSEDDDLDEVDDSDSADDADSADDDEGMFRGKDSWADEDEAFIRALSSQVGGAGIGHRANAAPSSKRAQKKLFHAISRGDFTDLVDLASAENDIDSDDPAYGIGSIPTARNGKRKGRKFTSDDLWAEELQQQWDKDRVTKATKKQQRLTERQAAALNPFPNTHGKAGSGKSKATKKAAKLARKAEKREMRASLRAHSNNVVSAINAAGSVDAVDHSLLTFGGKSVAGDALSLGLDKRFAFNMDELNQQIQLFLSDKGRTTMRCQAMDKFARAEVHALANAYHLQSKSKGKGRDRFPTLIKTSKSGLNVDYRKVKRIVYSNAGATFGNDAGRSNFKDKGRNKKGHGGGGGGMYGVGGGTVPKNKDGEEVGFGADKIGADNIGHKLLAAMGWTEGSGIGSSQGMANPVSATVKISRGGLGF